MSPVIRVVWIPVGGPCNARCAGCTGAVRPPVLPEPVHAAAEAARPAVAVLTGPGEPTLRDDLPDLVHAARRGGAVRVALVTNGRMLAYRRQVEALVGLRLSHVIVSLHHGDPAEHDRRVAVPGAFAQTLQGIRQVVQASTAEGPRVIVRTPAAEDLPRLAALARDLGACALWLDGRARAAAPARGVPVIGGDGIEPLLLGGAERGLAAGEDDVHARVDLAHGALSLVVRTGCRNACAFCSTRFMHEVNGAHWRLDDLARLRPALERGRAAGVGALRLVAIEPLEHPDIVTLVHAAHALGYDEISAATSGRALAEPGLARRLREAGLTAVAVPLLGATAAVHDAVAGARGAHAETLAGLREARRFLHVTTHLIVVEPNAHELPALLALASELGTGKLGGVLLPAPSPGGEVAYPRFTVRLSRLAAILGRLPLEPQRAALLGGLARQIPPCVLWRAPGVDPGLLDRAAELPREEGHRDATPGEAGAKLKLRAPCPLVARCALAPGCPGLYPLYVASFGLGELDPEVAPRR